MKRIPGLSGIRFYARVGIFFVFISCFSLIVPAFAFWVQVNLLDFFVFGRMGVAIRERGQG